MNCRSFCFWPRRSVVFVCVWNISRTAERICAKFTCKTCLVPRLVEFEGQRSRSSGKKTAFSALSAACVRFMFGKTSLASSFYVCVWNISGTSERICARFTRKMCLVPRSDEFEGQGERSRWPGTKNGIFRPFWQLVCGLYLVKHL